MVALFVQTLLLMAAAYFIGAAVACIVRRSLHTRQPVAAGVERRVDRRMSQSEDDERHADRATTLL